MSMKQGFYFTSLVVLGTSVPVLLFTSDYQATTAVILLAIFNMLAAIFAQGEGR
jgi:hypothetical protein